ncbi:MAG TPA: TetR/AcrR family transcriptional regulator [Stellaceae bacterium]|nr:TetR/AcrR family transcriptional regulator [Stellaceae bacterium]
MRRRKAVAAKKREGGDGAGAPSARERLLEAAGELFYRQGIRPVGVDEVVAKADVAKMSLYRSFPSKDELAAAYLEANDAWYWERWDNVIGQWESQPREQLRALFRGLAKRATQADWRGCPFTNAATEFPEPGHPARKVAERHKQELRRRLFALARAVGARRPAQLADQLVLLFEGAYASAQTFGAQGPAAAVAEAADALVAAQLG